jgi:hypothetical protein
MFIGTTLAFADAGAVRLRETSGPFIVTVFTEPAVPRAGPLDVSVLLQRSDSGCVVLHASVELFLAPPLGASLSPRELFCSPNGAPLRFAGAFGSTRLVSFPATRAQSGNRLLYSAHLQLPAPGTWHLRLRIRDGDSEANLETQLSVSADRREFSTAWPYLVLPLCAAGLFALHQKLSQRSARKLELARPALAVDSLHGKRSGLQL